ncbi:hypothetical protein BDV93DRAFT_528276, partial [Ceratobasidium sp. AG-I]
MIGRKLSWPINLCGLALVGPVSPATAAPFHRWVAVANIAVAVAVTAGTAGIVADTVGPVADTDDTAAAEIGRNTHGFGVRRLGRLGLGKQWDPTSSYTCGGDPAVSTYWPRLG